MAIILVSDLPTVIQSAELVQIMVDGANSRALRVAPCLGYDDDEEAGTTAPTAGQLAEARLILVGAIKRWAETGAGSFQSQTAGPFGVTVDTRQRSGYNLWPTEITGLQDICANDEDGSAAFAVDTVGCSSIHSPICALAFGAAYCSCMADIAGLPLYEDVEP